MSKKRLVFLLSVILLVIGGLMFHVHQMSEEEKLQAQIRKEQERMVLYATNHYEGIEKIEFTSFEKNDMTGVWSSVAVVNDEYRLVFDLWGFDGRLSINDSPSKQDGSYLILKQNERETQDISNVNITYWEKGR